jgi:hypothetical protein
MHRTKLSGIMFATLVAGCVVEAPERIVDANRMAESGDGYSVARSDENRLSVNRLSMNRLSLNRLSLNRLSLNRLSLNRLSLNSLASDGLETTNEGRELLTYVAKCALRETDILVAQHNGVTYEFPGLLGVASEWESAPLTTAGQHWVSGCLLAHVNAFGTSVPISLRAVGKLDADVTESLAFPVYEATFFGNVFNVEQDMYGCTGDMPDVANALSTDRQLRVCSDAENADGTSQCQFITLGRCRDVCTDKHSPKMGWTGCTAEGIVFPEAVSVYLTTSVPASANMYCPPGARCDFRNENGQDGNVSCTDADRCTAKLRNDSVYKVDCADTGRCDVECRDDMLAEVDCAGSDRCQTDCKDGSACEIDCQGADKCNEIRCTGGSECLLHCEDANKCGFKKCDGQVRQCPGNILVCNAECPT